MKTKLLTTVAMMLILGTFSFAQERTRPGTFGALCNQITLKQNADLKYGEKITREYEVTLWKAAGADLDKDTVEEAVVKIQKWWDIYKRDELNCGGVPILQYALNQQFESFTFTLIDDYQVDANFVSNVDNTTLLDSVNTAIESRLGRGVSVSDNPLLKSLIFLKQMLIEKGAKSVLELTKRSEWTAALYRYSGTIKFDKFRFYNNYGEDFERNYQTILTEFDKAIEMEPKNTDVYWERIYLNLFGKDYAYRLTSALADINKLLDLNGSDASLYALRAEANCRLGNKTAARADENKAFNLDDSFRYGDQAIAGNFDTPNTRKRCQ